MCCVVSFLKVRQDQLRTQYLHLTCSVMRHIHFKGSILQSTKKKKILLSIQFNCGLTEVAHWTTCRTLVTKKKLKWLYNYVITQRFSSTIRLNVNNCNIITTVAAANKNNHNINPVNVLSMVFISIICPLISKSM